MAFCDCLQAQQETEQAARRAVASSALNKLVTDFSAADSPDLWPSFADEFALLIQDTDTILALRRAILALAICGRLVAQCATDEPAAVLVERISKKLGTQPAQANDGLFKIPDSWTWATFTSLGIFGRGRSRNRPRNDPALYVGGTYPLVQTGDVARANGTVKSWTTMYNVVGLEQSKMWPKGTLCITIAANIADTAILGFDACFPDSVVGFVPDPEIGDARYFEYFMRTAKADLLAFAPSTAQKNINLGILEQVLIPIPPLAEQRRIVARVDELMSLCNKLDERVADSERLSSKLFASIISEFSNPDPNGSRSVEAITKERDEIEADKNSKPLPAEQGLKPQALSVPTAAPVDTKFQEAALVGAIVKSFFADGGEPIGNFRLQKAVYFARRHNADPSATADFLKKAAGPYNPSMKYSGGIAIAKAKSYITEARGRYGFGHIPGATIAELEPAVERYGYGESATWVNQHFKFKKNEEWELLATVDYAMLQVRDATPADILAYVANDPEWRPKIEKLGLTEFKIESAMLEIRALFPNANGSA